MNNQTINFGDIYFGDLVAYGRTTSQTDHITCSPIIATYNFFDNSPEMSSNIHNTKCHPKTNLLEGVPVLHWENFVSAFLQIFQLTLGQKFCMLLLNQNTTYLLMQNQLGGDIQGAFTQSVLHGVIHRRLGYLINKKCFFH